MQIAFKGTLTRDDYRRAVSLHGGAPVIRWIVLGLFWICLVLLMARLIIQDVLLLPPQWFVCVVPCAVIMPAGLWLLLRFLTHRA